MDFPSFLQSLGLVPRTVCCEPLRKGRMHIDHVVPLVRGGAHADGNTQLLCAGCNLSKNSKTMAEFLAVRRGS